VEIAIVRLPHIANFDEFAALANEPRVALRYVTRPDELRAPDLLILPGTKATIPDVLWLHERGLADRIRWLAGHSTPVLGICGGYQMLGEVIRDPARLESEHSVADGLSLLAMQTELGTEKRVVRTRGHVRLGLPGVWHDLGGSAIEGYEIHMGKTSGTVPAPFLNLEGGADGGVDAEGWVAGSYVHGVFESAQARHALVQLLARRRGFEWRPTSASEVDPYDRLADVVAENVTLRALLCLS
jgi:adenosylcobyric acid synthase